MTKRKNVTVEKVISKFEFEILNSGNLNELITQPSINRFGLEIAQKVDIYHEKNGSIIGWGTSEMKYFQNIGLESTQNIISNIFENNPPMLVLSKGFNDPEILKIIIHEAQKVNLTVVKSEDSLSYMIANVGVYLWSIFAKEIAAHASLVVINGVGVMIVGKSGIGKSEAVLELIQKGHIFVSDDTVNIMRLGKYFVGRPSRITENLLETRGIGIMNIREVFGAKSVIRKTNIDIVAELIPYTEDFHFDRLGNQNLWYNALVGKIKKFQIPVQSGRSTSSLIEAAVSIYLSNSSKKEGSDPIDIIRKRIQESEE